VHTVHARHDAPPGLGAGLHVVRPVLHVAVLPAGGRAPRVRRSGRVVAALRGGHRVGRRLLRVLLGRLLRLLADPSRLPCPASPPRSAAAPPIPCACSAERPG
jgi:hypothetical protein